MEEWKEYKASPWGIIPTHWKISSIKEETDVVTDYVANGSFASLAENVKYKSEKDYAVLIRLVDYNNQFRGDFVYIDKNAYEFLGKSKLYGDEIIISNVGANVGTVFRCPHLGCKMSLAPNSIMVKFNGNNDFYYYWLKSRFGQHMLKSIVTGSAQPKFNKTNFRDLQIPVPPIEEQEAIASILKSLDDKIEVNRKICENLEQQAQALFKSWFVDFEPFKNGEFVESELGRIPKGWRVGKLSEIADVNPYRNLKKGINALYLDMKNMPTKGSFPMNWDYKLYSGGMKFKNEDTLMARITPCLENGKVAYVNFLEDDEIAFGSTEYIVMTPKDGFMPELLYFLCRDDFFKGYATKNMNGSSGRQRVSAETIGKYPIAIPPKVQIESIASYYKGIMDNVKKNGLESRRLASLRDTLLPKLMSGELKVNEL